MFISNQADERTKSMYMFHFNPQHTTLGEGISVTLLIDLHVLLYLSVCSLGKILTEHLLHVAHHIGCSSGFKR